MLRKSIWFWKTSRGKKQSLFPPSILFPWNFSQDWAFDSIYPILARGLLFFPPHKSDALILDFTHPESRNGEVVFKFSPKTLTRVKSFNSWLEVVGVSRLDVRQTQVFIFTAPRAENTRYFWDNPGQGLKEKKINMVKSILGVSPLGIIFSKVTVSKTLTHEVAT